MPWKYLSNFWRSLKMPLINWKVELKIKCTNYCVLSAAGTMMLVIGMAIKDTILFVPFVILSARDNQQLSKILSKGFERSVYWKEYIKKVRKKI